MIPNSCIEIHTSVEDRPSVPAWFAEVVIVSCYLAKKRQIEAFVNQVRLVRGRFGSYEPIDFLVLLIGYAMSAERTLADFFERVAPFEKAFMALFGRKRLPHRATLSRFLADVDRPCLEGFRSLFEQQSFTDGWDAETIGGIFDRQGRRFIIFDVDATRQAARQRALPTAAELPVARRRLEKVCAPGYKGRKRGEVVRTRTTILQMHTRQWIGTYAGKGNGDYQGELAQALRAIVAYLKSFTLPSEAALVRLDGQYGDAVAIAQLMRANVHLLTRGRGYRTLDHPQIQQVLANPPTACVTSVTTNETVELFEGGWLQMSEGLPLVRVIVARHRAPEPGKPVRVGKRVNEWVYELFLTTLPADGFLVEDVLDLYHGRGAFEAVLADEDIEEDPDRWCSYTECGQELWQIACQWVWNLRLALGYAMQGGGIRDIEWSSPKECPPLVSPSDEASETYGPWQLAKGGGRGQFAGSAFTVQDDGTLHCPAGATLWFSELRQENAFTQRAVFLASLEDCHCCTLREHCLRPGAKGDRARRLSAVRHLTSPSAIVSPRAGVLQATRWKDVPGRAFRRSWTAHWRRQSVEVLPLAEAQADGLPPPRSPRAIRSHRRWSWLDRLTRNACWGPPHVQVRVAGVPAFLAER